MPNARFDSVGVVSRCSTPASASLPQTALCGPAKHSTLPMPASARAPKSNSEPLPGSFSATPSSSTSKWFASAPRTRAWARGAPVAGRRQRESRQPAQGIDAEQKGVRVQVLGIEQHHALIHRRDAAGARQDFFQLARLALLAIRCAFLRIGAVFGASRETRARQQSGHREVPSGKAPSRQSRSEHRLPQLRNRQTYPQADVDRTRSAQGGAEFRARRVASIQGTSLKGARCRRGLPSRGASQRRRAPPRRGSGRRPPSMCAKRGLVAAPS